MIRVLSICIFAFLTSGSFAVAGQEDNARYFLKPSEVPLPQGTEWGQVRRTIQPFENWTLICDENLKRKEKTCNISQIVINRSGEQVFSWSLAATREGEPFMLLRVPATASKNNPLAVSFPGHPRPVLLTYKGCDNSICLAMMPVGPVTRENIEKESDVTIAYTISTKQQIEIVVPLKGLSEALKAIK